MKRHVVHVGRLSIHVVESAGTGYPVILLHGNSCGSFVFRHQLEGEIGSRFKLFAVDLPGHGQSGWATKSRAAAGDESAGSLYTIPGYARMVVEVVRQLDVPEAVLVGHSLGGHVALETTPWLPKAAGFFIVGTPPVGQPAAMDRAFLPNPNIAAAFQAEPPADMVNRYLADFFAPGTPVPDEFHQSYRGTDSRIRSVLQESVAAERYTDELHLVRILNRPLAVTLGSEERIVNGAYFDEVEIPTLWRGDLFRITGAGHTPQWETPADFDRLLTAFVDDVR